MASNPGRIAGCEKQRNRSNVLRLEYDIGNGTFGIGCYGEVWKPSPDGTCVAFEVDDLDAEISLLESKSVKFAMEATDTPICRFAIICDPDGNRILIHKRKAGGEKPGA